MLDVVLVRHAIAEEPDAAARAGRSEAQRRLTAAGRRKMEAAAAGLRRVLPEAGRIASSPLVRARETAAILAHAYESAAPTETDRLAPGFDPAGLLDWLHGQGADTTPVILVGHEPDLGRWVAWCTGCGAGTPVVFKKGTACRLEVGAPGEGRIRWLLTPRQLRALGEGA